MAEEEAMLVDRNDPVPDAADSLVDLAYREILTLLGRRGSILSQRLNATRLAETLDISRTPVSMALMRLEGERLVERAESQTWVTLPLSLEDLKGIFDIKELLDPLAARKAASLISPESARLLLATAGEMSEAAQCGDGDRWTLIDRRFHAILLRAVQNRDLTFILRRFSHRLHQLSSIKAVVRRRMTVASNTHLELARAISIRDPNLAAELALADVRHLREIVVRAMEDVVIPLLDL